MLSKFPHGFLNHACTEKLARIKDYLLPAFCLIITTISWLLPWFSQYPNEHETGPPPSAASSVSAAQPLNKKSSKKKLTPCRILKAQAPKRLFNLNEVSEEELLCAPQKLGKSNIEKIMQYREEFGGFKSLEELSAIKGIGPKWIKKYKRYFFIP